jgi:hypothetical protein
MAWRVDRSLSLVRPHTLQQRAHDSRVRLRAGTGSSHARARAVDEIQYLRSSIGRTGLLALQPIHVTSHRDDWHRHLLTGEFLGGTDCCGSRVRGFELACDARPPRERS